MNFMSNVLNSIPVVGHVKGVVHYAVGDTDGGNKAMYHSTRSTAVLAGGATGFLAGPVGAVVGAMYAGLAADGVASLATHKPQGIVKSCDGIRKDIKEGKNPTGSILSTGLQLGLDGVGGLGMSGIATAASHVTGQSVTKTMEHVGKKMVTSVGEGIVEKSAKMTAEKVAKIVTKKVSKQTEGSKSDLFEIFINLLEEILRLVYNNEKEPISGIFKEVSEKEKAYLVKVVTILKNHDMFDAVLELVVKMFKEHLSRDISFTNFLSLLEFVLIYISDEMNERNMISRGTETARLGMKYKERRAQIYEDIISQENIVQRLVDKFNQLRADIEAETLFPDFRDIFSAMCHYSKHKHVPADGMLSVKEYYEWIRRSLEKLERTPEYMQLINFRESSTCVYETYVVAFGKRFRTVVKIEVDKLALSSAFVVRIIYQDDKHEDVFIKIAKP